MSNNKMYKMCPKNGVFIFKVAIIKYNLSLEIKFV